MPVHSAWPAFDVAPRTAACRRRARWHRCRGPRTRSCLRSASRSASACLAQPVGEIRLAELRRQLGRVQLGLVDVALHLAQRDRRLGQRAVGMEHRVVRVLPALLHEAVACCAARTRRSRRRRGRRSGRSSRAPRSTFGQMPRTNSRSPVRCAVGARQHHEQRRRVDGAVVAAERHLARARPSRTCAPRAGSCPARRRAAASSRVGLRGGEEGEHAARERRVDPQGLARGDDAVAAEGGGVPGHAGVGVGPGAAASVVSMREVGAPSGRASGSPAGSTSRSRRMRTARRARASSLRRKAAS